jgi:hypothetical protein
VEIPLVYGALVSYPAVHYRGNEERNEERRLQVHRPLFTDRLDRAADLRRDAGPPRRPRPGRKETTCARPA